MKFLEAVVRRLLIVSEPPKRFKLAPAHRHCFEVPALIIVFVTHSFVLGSGCQALIALLPGHNINETAFRRSKSRLSRKR